jgi:hypothetical protein
MNSLAAESDYSQCDKGCGGDVYILIIGLLLLVLFAALTLGLVSVLQELVERYCQSEPMFGEQGPIFHDQDSEQQPSRSQFTWQSRSHSQGPD